MAFTIKIRKVTVLPGSMEASCLYFVKKSNGLMDVYLSDSTGATAQHVYLTTEIQAMIDATVTASMSAAQEMKFAADITARNALGTAATQNIQVFVLNATGDATVASGSATYFYNLSTTTWYKVSESESQDLTLSWANITGKPTSTPAAIDSAVAASHTHTSSLAAIETAVTDSHTHANKATLDKFAEANSLPTYNGTPLHPYLAEEGW